jgi:hypothetical protein
MNVKRSAEDTFDQFLNDLAGGREIEAYSKEEAREDSRGFR